MRELNTFGKADRETHRAVDDWVLILFGLLGFTQIQCSEAPSQTPSADNFV